MNKTIKSIAVIMLGNIFTLLAGVATSFILPKLLTVSGYGYYKTYTLYSTYIGLLSLGIIDGIVLEYGNYDYDELNREKFRSYFRWYFMLHIVIALVLLCTTVVVGASECSVILLFIAFELVAVNCLGYFQQISQITRRFNEFSTRKVLQSVITFMVLLFLLFIYQSSGNFINYRVYIIITLVINYILFGWYIWTYKDIVFGKRVPMRESLSEVLQLAKSGIPLMVANICSTLILTLDRQFVNVLFDMEQYAIYAFAYNLLSLVTVMISAISTVLYPTLKRENLEKLEKQYPTLVGIILIISFGALTVYFPLTVVIDNLLPRYRDSLEIFKIVFPGVALSTPITTIMHNYYKIYQDNFRFFKKGIVAIIISFFANIVAYFIFGTMESISVASIITLIIWYIIIDSYFRRKINGYKCTANLVYIVIMVLLFYVATAIENICVGFVLYFVMFAVMTLFNYKRILMNLLHRNC